MLKFEKGKPGLIFTFGQSQPTTENKEWEGKTTTYYKWSGTPDMLSASETLMNKIKEWNGGTFEGLQGKKVWLELIETKKGYPYWVVENPPEIQAQNAPVTNEPLPTPPQKSNEPASSISERDLWIRLQTIYKSTASSKTVDERCLETLQAERLLRRGVSAVVSGEEITTDLLQKWVKELEIPF